MGREIIPQFGNDSWKGSVANGFQLGFRECQEQLIHFQIQLCSDCIRSHNITTDKFSVHLS